MSLLLTQSGHSHPFPYFVPNRTCYSSRRTRLIGGHMKRREFIGLVAGLSASWSVAALAQKKPFQVGWLVFGDSSLGPTDRSLKDALPQIGLTEGHNL